MSATLLDHIMARITETEGPLDTPCWITTFTPTYKGYARVTVAGRTIPCHRVTYELLVGPIPEGLQLDHLCRVRNCVNPAHLEPVTGRENVLRGNSPTAIAVRTNKCKRGHSLDDAYIDGGKRRCRICTKARWRRRRRQSRLP